MRIHAASASASVTRTLEAVIAASGHDCAPSTDAELILIDGLHPPALTSAAVPHLTLGNDVLPCPLHPQHLMRLLRHRTAHASLALDHGWTLDLTARALTHAAMPPITLTEKESALLCALKRGAPTAIARETLLAQVWGITHEIDTHTLETHIYRLRSKLGACTPCPCDIETIGGAYRIVEAT